MLRVGPRLARSAKVAHRLLSVGALGNTELLSSRLAKKLRTHAKPGVINVIGAPTGLGQPLPGVDCGPRVVRDAGLHSNLSRIGWQVNDVGDLSVGSISVRDVQLPRSLGKAINCTATGRAAEEISKAVRASLKQSAPNDFTLLLGGDRSCAIGSISGVLSNNLDTGVIWISAHASLLTPWESGSSYIHSMAVSFLLENLLDHSTIPGFEWLGKPSKKSTHSALRLLKPSQIVFVGLREADRVEVDRIRELGIRVFTMYDIDRLGMSTVMGLATEHLSLDNPERPLHLMYDVSAIDPAVAPATFSKVAGGLTFREAHFVAETLGLTGRLRSMDIVEINPTLAPPEGVQDTVQVAVEVVLSAVGHNILSRN